MVLARIRLSATPARSSKRQLSLKRHIMACLCRNHNIYGLPANSRGKHCCAKRYLPVGAQRAYIACMQNSTALMLAIGGSDCCSGAGIQADLKAASAQGVYCLCAVSCVVAEIPGKVLSIQGVEPQIVADQLAILFENYPLEWVKTGMLWSPQIMEVVIAALERYRPRLVVDPVMIASSGDSLIESRALELLQQKLLPLATLITPNMDELGVLVGRPIETVAQLQAASIELAAKYSTQVFGKGGHLPFDQQRYDCLANAQGLLAEWSSPTLHDIDTHGTGCSLAASCCALLSRGLALEEACGQARSAIASAIKNHHRWQTPQARLDALRLL